MIGTMYGAVTGDYPGSETWQGEFDGKWVEPTLYLVRFEITELRKDASFRPGGTCFITVVFKSTVALPELGLSPEQLLYWGGNAPLDSNWPDMLPFSTGPYQGFRELGSERLIGHGAFFRTLEEVQARSKLGSGENIVSLVWA